MSVASLRWVAALTRSLLRLLVLVAIMFVVLSCRRLTIARMSLPDPYGRVAFGDITRYWTVFDRNTLVPGVTGALLMNRLIWLSVAVVALVVAAYRFRFTPRTKRRGGARREQPQALLPDMTARASAPAFDAMLVVKQFLSQVRIDLRGVLKSYPFYVLLMFGMVNVIGGFFGAISQIFGTPAHPVTRIMLNVVEGNYVFIVFMIIVYYTGELVHRERDSGVARYVDAAPFPNGVMVAAKVAAMWTIVTLLLFVVMVTSMAVQAGHGYYRFEIMRYVVGLFVVRLVPVPLLRARRVHPNGDAEHSRHAPEL